MTPQRAKQIFANMMQIARKRTLSPNEKDELSKARQTLRMAKRPAMNPTGKTHYEREAEYKALKKNPIGMGIKHKKKRIFLKKDLITKRWIIIKSPPEEIIHSFKYRRDAIDFLREARLGLVTASELNLEKAIKTPSGDNKDFAYRGYIVRWIPSQNSFAISKDDFHIAWSKDRETAKKQIDMIANPKQRNPRSRSGVKIYGRILRIEAQKIQPHRCDSKCKKAGHRYFHDFTTRNAAIYGMPDGSLVVR